LILATTGRLDSNHQPFYGRVSLGDLRSQQIDFFNSFAATIVVLQSIVEKELAGLPLSSKETAVLEEIVEQQESYGAAEGRTFNGWYPGLFYRNVYHGNPFGVGEGSDAWDPLVTDVFTAAPDFQVGAPGSVLHEGVGNVHLLMIVVDSGPDRMVYAGPVLSHYQFEAPANIRRSDSEWKSTLQTGVKPPSPEWTESYLVPTESSAPFTAN